MRFRMVRCDWVRYGLAGLSGYVGLGCGSFLYGEAGKVGWVDFGFGAVR